MKLNIIMKLLGACLMATIPLLSLSESITFTVTYDSNNIIVGSDTLGGVTYSTFQYDGLNNGGLPGYPSLPIDYIKFSVPYNARNFRVSATSGNTFDRRRNNYAYPNQVNRLSSDTSNWSITYPDSTIYSSSLFYPSIYNAAWIADEGVLAGENHIITVGLMPFSYKHFKTGVMRDVFRVMQSVNLTLSYDINDSVPISPIIRQREAERLEGFALTQLTVVNPNQVTQNAPPYSMDTINLRSHFPPELDTIGHGIPGSLSDPLILEMAQKYYPYLIVTTTDLLPAMKKIAALKRQKGYNVLVVNINDILNDTTIYGDRIKRSDGTTYIAYDDDAGKLRQYLKLAYRFYKTKYVLFAGTGIPFRYLTFNVNGTIITPPSDLYYSDLNADWSVGLIDKQPEIYVGRLLAKQTEQIENYTEKLLRYELNPGSGDYGYLRRILYSESYDMVNNGEVYNLSRKMRRVFPDSTWMHERRDLHATDKYPSGEDIINKINSTQFGYLSLHDHGCPAGLITYGYRHDPNSTRTHWDSFRFLWAIDSIHVLPNNSSYINDDPSVLNGLNCMSNRLYPNVCFSVGCTTMPYDTIPDFESIPMNFGESFTTGKDYGGPAFIGNTREGIMGVSSSLEKLFADILYSGFTKAGQALGLSKGIYNTSDSIYNKYVPVTTNLLGDPEFAIWTNVPESYSNISIIRNDTSVYVSGIVDSTFVAYSDNTGEADAIIASSNITLKKISPNSTIMLYNQNHIPFIAPLMLQNMTAKKSQYIFASDLVAGHSVDNNRTSGDVIIKNGVEFEIEATGTVTLEDGFKVEKGATFAVYPSSF